MNVFSIAYRWHRPLMTVAALMVACAVVALIGLTVDSRTVTGLDVWVKPLKFSLSIFAYCVTWAWLIAHMPRWRRLASVSGTVIAIALAVEQVVIIGAAVAGTTSHFNVSTPLSAMGWIVMSVSIIVLYLATFATSIALMYLRLPDRSLTLAVGAGAGIAVVGLGLAYLMTGPTAAQLNDFQGIAGAHTVGLADGGPGLAFLGWSTVGGDLRIPHFIGMHALQILPLAGVLLAAFGHRVMWLRDERVRTRLVFIGAISYLGVVTLTTVQAVSGESIIHPSAPVVAVGLAIAAATLIASIIVIRVGATSPSVFLLPSPPPPHPVQLTRK